jgi:exodeoxyribonuclease VII large subunit
VLEGTTMDVLVRGEVTGLRAAGSGHIYFSLRDEREDACIDCVMYRTAPPRARKRLQNGERVVVRGQVTFYAPRGRIQFIAEDVLQTARGALLEALEELKKKLAAEGLFAPERKKPLPREPRVVAVVSSRDGAAIHDIVRVAFRRGRVRIVLVPTPVQGAGAADRIAAGILRADRIRPDAIVVARGGGSAEDLAAYNEEVVVRAIGTARAPVVSAVGHEIDTTLADLAADARAATPSQAAELLVPDWQERARVLEHLGMRLRRAVHHRLATGRELLTRVRSRLGEPRTLVLEQAQHVDELVARLERAARKTLGARRARLETQKRKLESQHPRRVLAAARVRLGPLEPRLAAAMRARVEAARHRTRDAAARLDAMSPLAVLGRGYAIATRPDGTVVTDAAAVGEGDELDVRLHQGRVRTRVI